MQGGEVCGTSDASGWKVSQGEIVLWKKSDVGAWGSGSGYEGEASPLQGRDSWVYTGCCSQCWGLWVLWGTADTPVLSAMGLYMGLWLGPM